MNTSNAENMDKYSMMKLRRKMEYSILERNSYFTFKYRTLDPKHFDDINNVNNFRILMDTYSGILLNRNQKSFFHSKTCRKR